jgi:DNA-binding XRE family transcriptional regulator
MMAAMAHLVPSPDVGILLARARMALGMSQGEMGDALQLSRKTLGRMETGRSSPTLDHIADVARRVHPADAALAASLAREAGHTLETLGLAPSVPPAPEPPPATRPFPPIHALLGSILHAGTEAAAASPGDVRAILRAGFASARALGLTLEEVDAALSPSDAPAAKAARTR